MMVLCNSVKRDILHSLLPDFVICINTDLPYNQEPSYRQECHFEDAIYTNSRIRVKSTCSEQRNKTNLFYFIQTLHD